MHRVHYRQYDESFDLAGKDLFSLLDRPKSEVAALIGEMAPKASMPVIAMPAKSFVSMTGEIPDEVHEWPQARLGAGFKHLVLDFRDDRLMGFRWKHTPMTAQTESNKPWYRRWIWR